MEVTPMSDQSEKPTEERVADDILRGAAEIAAELGVEPMDVYYLHKTKRYPISKLGKILIASRRQLRRTHRALTSA
jgi:hypothetical protein